MSTNPGERPVDYDYKGFFTQATEGKTPYPYQQRLAEGDTLPAVLKIPTGAGKTEAAILGWLYRRRYHSDPQMRSATPRRLVYCLPMRSLVEQTVGRCQEWLENLGLKDDIETVVLMGGSKSRDWKLYPERDAIIIGTQDMLLSRALNRGYGMSQFQWPIEFGLLNNDCLWVLDEVQLMANGLPTSAQMAGFRSPNKLKTYGPTHTMWMSATVRPEWLQTYDHPTPAPIRGQVRELDPAEMSAGELGKRNTASKTLRRLDIPGSGQPYIRQLARTVIDLHQKGTLTLVVVNTVRRAQDIYRQLERQKPEAETVLLHSRFRPGDRAKATATVTADPGGLDLIAVSTQAVEAGVDISARVLISDLAPWSSMVQRFGRCNRRGEYQGAEVFWLDVSDGNAAPYEPEPLAASRAKLDAMEGQSVSPADLPDAEEPPPSSSVLRRRDLLGLFDTTPDLSGNYLDVSRYVRGSDDTDVQVFWRQFDGSEPSEDEKQPVRTELCGVPIGDFRKFLTQTGTNRRAWRWDFLDERWSQVRGNELVPGQTLMLKPEFGGYTTALGWTGDRTEVPPVPDDEPADPSDSMDSDPHSANQHKWVTLADHSQNVRRVVEWILSALDESDIPDELKQAVIHAALHHDAGKAHHVFQDNALEHVSKDIPDDERARFSATTWGKYRGGQPRYARRHFRHEVASALAILQHRPPELEGRTLDLAAYLAASHHGKVRLAIRSTPGRNGRSPVPGQLLGYLTEKIETLDEVDLGGGVTVPETALDMSIAHIGMTENDEPSWLDRTLSLLDWLGPFRLAYLEALVRAADVRASIDEQEGGDING